MANHPQATNLNEGGSKQTQQRKGPDANRRGSEGSSTPAQGRNKRDDQGPKNEQASPKAGSGQGSRKN